MYVAYVSYYQKYTKDSYFERYFLSEVNNSLKIIAVQLKEASDSIKWDYFKGYEEGVVNIPDLGDIVQRKKIQPPNYEPHLLDYNELEEIS